MWFKNITFEKMCLFEFLKWDEKIRNVTKCSYQKISALLFPCFNRYVISAPKIFHVGASENIVIQVYGYTEEFDATISLKSYPDKKFSYSSGYVTLSTENKFQNSAILTVRIYSSLSLYIQNILHKMCINFECWYCRNLAIYYHSLLCNY